MAQAFNQWLRITKEITYGVAQTHPGTLVEGTDFVWAVLDQDNPFTMRAVPAQYVIRTANAQNRRWQVGSKFYALSGNLNTLFYPTLAGFLLDAALKLTSNDLTSYTIDYFDSQRTFQYLGCKVASLGLRQSAQQQVARLAFAFVGQQDVDSPTSLAAPAASDFPAQTSQPYTHQDTAGAIKLNNVVRAKYSDFHLDIKNLMDGTVDELPYISALYWCGRDVDWGFRNQYASAADRAAWKATTAQGGTTQIEWFKGTLGSPTNSVTLNLHAQSYITKVDDELALGKAAYQAIEVATLYDGSASNDIDYTVV